MAVIEGTTRIKTAVAEYDFAIDGGAVGNISLRSVDGMGATIPSGAIIHSGFVDVITPLASGGAATAGLGLEAAGDLVGPVVVTNAAWNSAGRKNINPGGTGSTTVKTTATRQPTLAVGVAPLTAGKIRVVKFYI
jgi:hypothetical protein